jgi:hypothetical protein
MTYVVSLVAMFLFGFAVERWWPYAGRVAASRAKAARMALMSWIGCTALLLFGVWVTYMLGANDAGGFWIMASYFVGRSVFCTMKWWFTKEVG